MKAVKTNFGVNVPSRRSSPGGIKLHDLMLTGGFSCTQNFIQLIRDAHAIDGDLLSKVCSTPNAISEE